MPITADPADGNQTLQQHLTKRETLNQNGEHLIRMKGQSPKFMTRCLPEYSNSGTSPRNSPTISSRTTLPPKREKPEVTNPFEFVTSGLCGS